MAGGERLVKGQCLRLGRLRFETLQVLIADFDAPGLIVSNQAGRKKNADCVEMMTRSLNLLMKLIIVKNALVNIGVDVKNAI